MGPNLVFTPLFFYEKKNPLLRGDRRSVNLTRSKKPDNASL